MSKYKKEELSKIVKESESYSEVLRKYDLIPSGGNHTHLKRYIKQYELDTSHFTGKAWNRGRKYMPYSKSKYTLEEIMVKNSPYMHPQGLKERLFLNNLKQKKCERCGNTQWNNVDIPLHMHHINGDSSDNRLENLEILCPNCHALTNNHSNRESNGTNKHRRKNNRYKKYKNYIGAPIQEKTCEQCGNEYSGTNKRYCSMECKKIAQHATVPTKTEIIEAFKTHKNFLQVGKHFGVSDNAVRKWCKSYDIFEAMKNKKF